MDRVKWLHGTYESSKGPFLGAQAVMSIENDNSRQEIFDQMYLWHMTFTRHKSQIKEYYKYIVLDIDLELTDRQRVEFINDIKSKNVDKYLNLIAAELKEFFEKTYIEIWFSGSKGFHIYIYSPQMIFKTKDLNYISRYNIISFLQSRMPTNITKLLDTSIYFKKKGIRSYMQPNPKTGLMPFVVKTINDQFIPAMDIFEYLYNAFTGPYIYEMMNTNIPKTLTITTSDTTSITDKNDINVLANYIFTKTGIPTKIIQKKNFLYISSCKYCFISEKPHKGSYWKVYPNCGFIQKCHSHNCLDKQHKVCLPHKPVVDLPFCNTAKSIMRIKGTKYIDENIINDFVSRNDREIMLLLACMGSGKTTRLQEALERNRNSIKVLIIGTRKVQCNVFSNIYKCENYLNIKGSLFDKQMVCVCINSLERILGPGAEIPIYDVLVLDEILSLVIGLSNSLMTSSNKISVPRIFKILSVLMNQSKKVIMMDGLPDLIIEDFLKILDLWKYTDVVIHLSRPDNKIYKLMGDVMYFNRIYEQKIEDNEKICLVSNSNEVLKWYNLPKDRSSLIITGDSTDEEKKTSASPNDNWCEYDTLLYNTAVGPGPSFDKQYFDSLFVFIRVSLVTPKEMLQLMGRIRSLKSVDQNIYVLILPGIEQDAVTFEEVFAKCCNNIIEFDKKYRNLNVLTTHIEEVRKESAAYNNTLELMGVKRKFPEPDSNPKVSDLTYCYNYEYLENDLVRTFGGEPRKVRLAYEKGPLLKLFCKQISYCSKTAKLKSFYNEFIDLIICNGGFIETLTKIDVDNPSKKHRNFLKQVRKEVKDNQKYSYIFQIADSPIAEKVRRVIDITNVDSHFRFLKLVYTLNINSLDDYRCAEIRKYFSQQRFQNDDLPNKIFNATPLWSEITEDFKNLLVNLNLKFQDGYFIGSFQTKDAYTNIDIIYNILKRIHSQLSKGKFVYMLQSCPPFENKKAPYTLIKDIKYIFNLFGIDLDRSKRVSRPRLFGNRFENYIWNINLISQKLRYTLAGLNCDTLLADLKAYEYFVSKYI